MKKIFIGAALAVASLVFGIAAFFTAVREAEGILLVTCVAAAFGVMCGLSVMLDGSKLLDQLVKIFESEADD